MELFSLVDRRYEVNGEELKRRRLEMGLSRAKFGALCGWHASYIQQLEGWPGTVSESAKQILEGALRGVHYKQNNIRK